MVKLCLYKIKLNYDNVSNSHKSVYIIVQAFGSAQSCN